MKNELKRYLTNYVEHRGSNRNGGYYLKKIGIAMNKTKLNKLCLFFYLKVSK